MTHDAPALGTVFLIAIGSVVAALLSVEQWLAWLLLGATLILPLGFASIRDDGRLATVVYLVIACHHGLAFLLTFGEFRPIDLWDATYFDTLASWVVQTPEGLLTWKLGYLMYVKVLAGIYDINNAFFTGAEVSVLFSVIGLFLMIQIAREIEVPDERLWWVALAGFIPGSLIFFSVTYRESLQAFFLLLSVWAVMRILNRADLRWWILFAGALVSMGLLHKALLLYSLFLVIVTMMFVVFTKQRTLAWWCKAIGVAGIVLCVASVIVWTMPEFLQFFEPAIRLIDVDILDQITFYRERMVNWGSPRTDYGLFYDWTDWPRTAVTLGSIYLHYLFAPFDGITRWVDLYAVAEAWMRFVLLAVVGVGFFRIPRGDRKLLLFLLICYLSLTVFWSIGTTNYGQALRHHTMTNWMLFILFTAVVSRTGRLSVGLRRAGRAI